jgi:RNA polymerase sigma-70 factor (ECF subfamily)
MLTMNDPAVRASLPVSEDVAGPALGDRDRLGSSLATVVARPPDALDCLVAEHAPQVTRLVRRLLGWPGDVDDVVQDVFVAALRGLARFDRRSALSTWLTRIAINCCRSHQRRSAIRRWLPLRAVVDELPAVAADPAEKSTDEETQGQVRAAIRQLPARDREVIVLRYLEERSIDEIAGLCGSSNGAIEVRLSRARRKLETLLKPFINP